MSKQEGLRWIAAGQNDLVVAESLLAHAHYHAAAFHAQQSAEKALKGLLRLYGHVAWGHNCIVLLQQAESLLPDSVGPSLPEAVKRLTRHYITSRYPDAYDTGTPHTHYQKGDAQQAINDAKAVLAFVQENQ